jgi:integrase
MTNSTNTTKRATVTKRSYIYKGKTEDRWLVRWTDLKGKRREKWKRNKRHADAYANKIDRELADNIHVPDGASVLFKQAAESYLKSIDQRYHSRDRDIAGSTRYDYGNKIKNHVIPAFGHIMVNKIRSIDIQRFANEKATTHKHRTVGSLVSLTYEILEYCVNQEEGWLARNPLKDRPVEIPGKAEKRITVPGFEEVRRLLEFLVGPKPKMFRRNAWANLRVAVGLAAFAGLRNAETCHLKWPDIDFANNKISVKGSRSWFDGDKATKSPAGVREVPMSPILRRILEEHYDYSPPIFDRVTGPHSRCTRRPDRVALQGSISRRDSYVMLKEGGGGMHAHLISKNFRLAMKLAGLTKQENGKTVSLFTMHDLRHFAVSSWLRSGMRIQDAQRHIGHASIKETIDTYGHLLPGDDHAHSAITKTASMFPKMSQSSSMPPLEPPTIDLNPTNDVPQIEGPKDQQIETPKFIPLEELMKIGDTVVDEHGQTISLVAPHSSPMWMPEMMELLREGVAFSDACKQVGRHRCNVFSVFRNHGMPAPSDIVRAIKYTRFTRLVDARYGDQEISERLDLARRTIWGWRALREGRGTKIPTKSLTKNWFSHYRVGLKWEKRGENDVTP